MSESGAPETISVIIPVGERQSPAEELYPEYKRGFAALGIPYEFVFVLDGARPQFEAALRAIAEQGDAITIVALTRSFGEATALMVGFEHASGSLIVTLPAYFQIEGREAGKLVAALDTADIVIGRRHPRAGGWFEALRRRAFHGLLASVTQIEFHDLGCSARAFN